MIRKNISEIVSDNIRRIRIDKGFKQTEIAKYLGIRQSSYNKIENNKTSITLNVLEKLSEIFEIPVVKMIEYQIKNENDKLTNELLEELILNVKSNENGLNTKRNTLILLNMIRVYEQLLKKQNNE